jgi:hypothetical protein
MRDDISERELEDLYDKVDAETARHPPSEEDLKREIDRMNATVQEEPAADD